MRAQELAAFAIARYIGVPIVHRTLPHLYDQKRPDPHWDGRILWMPPSCSYEELLHELGHFLECPNHLIRVPDFGLDDDDDPKAGEREDRAGLIEKGLTMAVNSMVEDIDLAAVRNRHRKDV